MKEKKVVLLCVDGLDPRLLARYVQAGYMPNIKRIIKTGCYGDLATTTPPQSPVAWESFITGKDPDQHGVFDFITRDPITYLPQPSCDMNNRSASPAPFWLWPKMRGTRIELLFLPNTYPPTQINGRMLSGMGTPDILGTQGTFQLFSTDKKSVRAGIVRKLRKASSQVVIIHGPKYHMWRGGKTSVIHMQIDITDKNTVHLTIGREQYTVRIGEFSSWITFRFRVGFSKSICGRGRFYLSSVSPELNLYLTPIQIHPVFSNAPISFPARWSKEVAQKTSFYYTLGLPHLNSSLREKVIDDDAYLQHAREIYVEREALILERIKNTEAQLVVPYIVTLDSIQHMYWENGSARIKKRATIIRKYYTMVDETVGKIIQILRFEDELYIVSDHGFGEFQYEVHVNSLLRDIGYLSLKHKSDDGSAYSSVDWGKTYAYAVGFNSIFINLKGRESQGIVSESQYEKVVSSLKDALLSGIPQQRYRQMIKKVYRTMRHFFHSPDLIIGYRRGYRTSWETCLGRVPKEWISQRTSHWCGDHMFDPSEVPGAFISNKKMRNVPKSIKDVIRMVAF